jgi:hypothetical protein
MTTVPSTLTRDTGIPSLQEQRKGQAVPAGEIRPHLEPISSPPTRPLAVTLASLRLSTCRPRLMRLEPPPR